MRAAAAGRIFLAVAFTALGACGKSGQVSNPDAGHVTNHSPPQPEPDAVPWPRQAAPNPIAEENAKPGDGDWYIGKEASHHEIEGYASDVSAEAGETLDVMVSTSTASDYTYAVYRLGWYGGQEARKVATGPTLHGTPAPACPADPTTMLVECDWPKSFSLTIGSDWVSGAYLIKLHRADGYERYVPFVVRDHRAADVLFKLAVNTDEAYNRWGGESLYFDSSHTMPNGRAYAASFDRPFDDGAGAYSLLWWERHAVRFLEQNGYDVTYGTSVDMYRYQGFAKGVGALLFAGHDEYWTARERAAVDEVMASGETSLVNLTANPAYWRVRLEPDAQGRPFRRVVCYKNEQAKDPDPDAGTTARFRDDPDPHPENALFGTMYENWLFTGYPLVVSDVSDPLFANTGFNPGDTVPGLVGYEYDKVFDNGLTPPGLKVLANSPVLNAQAYPSSSQVVSYTTPQGRLVFSAGSIYWPLALSTETSRGDVRIWRLTWNVLETALSHRRAARPMPTDWPDRVREDGVAVPRYARQIAEFAGRAGVHQRIDGPVASAAFASPTGIAVDSHGTVFVADSVANVIRAIKGGMVTTYAGDGVDGDLDGPAKFARFRVPTALAIGPDGALYVADSDNHLIRRIGTDADHTVTTYAGNDSRYGGYQDGPGAQAFFNRPVSLVFGKQGELYVVDEENDLIRVVGNDAQHTVSTFAGTWNGFVDGPALQAAFNYPTGITIGPDGTLYILDTGNARVRRIKPSTNPVVETVVGTGLFGFQDGTGDQAMLRGQNGILWMPSGVLFTDSASNRVRQFQDGADAAHTTVTTFAGTGLTGSTISTPDQTPVVAPAGIAVGPDGTLHVSDTGNSVIRTLTP